MDINNNMRYHANTRYPIIFHVVVRNYVVQYLVHWYKLSPFGRSYFGVIYSYISLFKYDLIKVGIKHLKSSQL